MSDQPPNIVPALIDTMSRVLCKSSPPCPAHATILLNIAVALSERFTFQAIEGDNSIALGPNAPEDQRLDWAPAVRRVLHRLRGQTVLAPLDRDLDCLEGIAESLERIFGAKR